MILNKNLMMTAMLALPASVALGQTKPPVAHFWADVATHSMSIPGMDDMDEGSMGMFGGFFGGTKNAGGAPGKWLDTALHTRNKPSGTLGSHAIPPALNMGSALPLVPVQVERGRSEGEADMERPKGRLLFYWGCSETVRPGQPRVLDFARAAPDEYSKFMIGRFAPDRGAKAVAGRSVWPNEQDRKRVPANASLNGDHAVSGEGVPAGLRFAIGAAHDFMPVWSRDGKQIAFASDRYGNFDLFVMPAEGGEARRLTYHSAAEYPYTFTGDDTAVVFGAARMDAAPGLQMGPGGRPSVR